jgi:hypothetical protein
MRPASPVYSKLRFLSLSASRLLTGPPVAYIMRSTARSVDGSEGLSRVASHYIYATQVKRSVAQQSRTLSLPVTPGFCLVQDEPRFPRPGRRSSVVISEQYSDRQLRALCVQQFEVSTFSTRGPTGLIPESRRQLPERPRRLMPMRGRRLQTRSRVSRQAFALSARRRRRNRITERVNHAGRRRPRRTQPT